MTPGQLAIYGSIAAVVTVVATSGQKIRAALYAIQNLWLARFEVDKNLASIIYRYCRGMKVSHWRARSFIGGRRVRKSTQKESALAFEMLSLNRIMFRKGWKVLFIGPGNWLFNPSTNTYERCVRISMPRFMWNSEEFLKKAIEHDSVIHAQKTKNRYAITRFYGTNKSAPTIAVDPTKRADHRPNSADCLMREAREGRAAVVPYKFDDIIAHDITDDPFGWYAFSDDVMAVVKKIRNWHQSKVWYKSKHIAWTRGLLIHGGPGTGKSLLLRCIAQDLDFPVFVFDLASMNNEEFVTYWSQCCEHTPCMILFEDFDAVFQGRNNITEQEQKVSFDCILNCISGINTSDGIFLGITTNHLDRIDPALGGITKDGCSTRPGRIDDVIELQEMNATCRTLMAQRILGPDIAIDKVIKQTEGMTAAQFIETCSQEALNLRFANSTDDLFALKD